MQNTRARKRARGIFDISNSSADVRSRHIFRDVETRMNVKGGGKWIESRESNGMREKERE